MFAGFGLKIWGYFAAGGALLIAGLTFWNKAKRAGRKEVRDAVNAKTTETILEIVETDNEIEEDMATKSDDAILDELLGDASNSDNK